jgi:hypothetical protein
MLITSCGVVGDGGAPQATPRRRTHYLDRLLWLYIVLLLFSVGIGIFLIVRDIQPKVPFNVQLVAEAWRAYNRADFAGAVTVAERCTSTFQKQADDIERKLRTADGESAPQTDAEKSSVLARGPLNDVATCFFIIGQSAVHLKQPERAIQAFEAATKYSHAFSYNQDGSFWSPARASAQELELLRQR